MASTNVAISPFINYGSYVTNLDTMLDSGCGYTNNATGQPYNAINGMVIVFNVGAIVMQVFVPYLRSSSYPVKYRMYAVNTWDPWQDIA